MNLPVMTSSGEFQTMPVLVLAARLCPRGLESTIYSLLLSAYNLGLGLGSLVSAGLTAVRFHSCIFSRGFLIARAV